MNQNSWKIYQLTTTICIEEDNDYQHRADSKPIVTDMIVLLVELKSCAESCKEIPILTKPEINSLCYSL